jgi:phage baseplate assembly protein V
MNQIETIRRLDNVIRLGTIAEIDLPKARVRVQSLDILTDWLPWLTLRAGNVKSWTAPSVGEQCLILSVAGEMNTGVVLTGIYASNAPSQDGNLFLLQFPDGAEISYHFASGALVATNCKTALIQAKNSVTIDSPTVLLTGNLQVKGSITAQGEVTGKGVVLSTHKHKNVQAGRDETGEPK